MYKKYDVIYSLGRDCSCAMYMKKRKLRMCSGPFDWLTHAGFEDRFKLMLNGFECFLDKKYLKPMPKPSQFPSDKNNAYYENTKTGLYFWHDFPADKTFENAYDEIKLKYERRIKRFYDNIQNKNRVLLIWLSQIDYTPDDVVLKCCENFCAKTGKQVDFLIIEHKEGLYLREEYKLADNIQRYFGHLQQRDENGVLQTLGNQQLIKPIFKEVRLYLPFSVRVKNILIRFVCGIVPFKKWRKNIKARLMNG